MGITETHTYECDADRCNAHWVVGGERRYYLPAGWGHVRVWTEDASVQLTLCPVHVHDAQTALKHAGMDAELIANSNSDAVMFVSADML